MALVWQGPTLEQRRNLRRDATEIGRFILFETAFWIAVSLAYLLGVR
jgi:hypothetical protein